MNGRAVLGVARFERPRGTGTDRSSSSSSGAGTVRSEKLNMVPSFSRLVTNRRPPWDSTMDRLIARPIPMPSDFVV